MKNIGPVFIKELKHHLREKSKYNDDSVSYSFDSDTGGSSFIHVQYYKDRT